MNVEDKIILITGGGSGIGLSLAKRLLRENAKAIICGRNADKLQQVKTSEPGLDIAVCDITSDSHIADLRTKLETDYGGIDMLINCAGVFEFVDYRQSKLSIAIQEREIQINLAGPIRMVHHFLPLLKQQNESAIVNVSSGLAFVPLTLAPVYCATKSAVHSWSRSLRYQLSGTSVKVFELMPPFVETEMVTQFKEAKMLTPEELADHFLKGLQNDRYEITPGQSRLLKMMSRVAPGFIFKVLNKQFAS